MFHAKCEKNSGTPAVLVLHKSRLETPEVIRERGYAVTTVIRAIFDSAASGDADMDILEQALSDGLRRGLITRAEIKQAKTRVNAVPRCGSFTGTIPLGMQRRKSPMMEESHKSHFASPKCSLPASPAKGRVRLFRLVLRQPVACWKMMMHPVSDYIDVVHTPFPRLFEGLGEVWEVLPKIGPFLKEWLEPSVEGDIRGEVHIEGPVFIGPGAQIMHGALILGPVYVGAGSLVGPGCYLRPNTIIGENAILGNSCELKNCVVSDSAEIPHWNYVGDSIVGHKAHLGAGVILSNWRHDHGSISVLDDRVEGGRIHTGLAKFGAVVGDFADLGAHAVLNPGSLIGRRSVVYGGVVWRGGALPADRIVKLRQELEIAPRCP